MGQFGRPNLALAGLLVIFLVLPFWCLLTRVVPDIIQRSSKTVVCVCVCVCVCEGTNGLGTNSLETSCANRTFLADCTIGRAFGTMCRLSVVCL